MSLIYLINIIKCLSYALVNFQSKNTCMQISNWFYQIPSSFFILRHSQDNIYNFIVKNYCTWCPGNLGGLVLLYIILYTKYWASCACQFATPLL